VAIVGLVVFALRGFLLDAALTNEHPDLLGFWLPRWTFLGRSIADLNLPAWNPYEMAGYRFAADPQSGWLYAPPMLLFSTSSPGVAIRAMIALQPLMAGLGMYGFLRSDGLGRPAATVGGLSLAGAVASSEIAISLPFSGTLAWTPLLLLAAARFVRAERWSRRIAWTALGGFSWSQVAGAHLSHGLVISTGLAVAYLAAHAHRGGRESWTRSAVFLAALPLLSLAVLTPRLDFIRESSLGAGYDSLARATTEDPSDEGGLQLGGVWAGWPLASSAAPGAYAGAAALLAVPIALRSWRRRPTVRAFAIVAAGTWLLLLPPVLSAGPVRRLILALPYGDVLLHNPGRLRYAWVLAVPVLAAAGVQSLLDDPPPVHRLAAWLAGGSVLWLGVPLAAGGDPARWQLFGAFLLPAAAGLLWVTRNPAWGPAAAAGLLTIELVACALIAGRWTGDDMLIGLENGSGPPAVQPLRAPDVDLDAFLAPTRLVAAIGVDRYLTWAPPAAAYEKGYLFAQEPTDWPALANSRGSLFEIRDALGYNPVQHPRYWSWMRAVNPLPLYYNAAALARPRLVDLHLLGVRYLVVPESVRPPVPGRVVATADGYDLFEIDDAMPYAAVVPDWTVVATPEQALLTVGWDGFTPRWLAAVEGGPGIQRIQGAAAGSATYQETGPEHATIRASAEAPSIVLVHTSYDSGWTATVDGRPTDVLPADAFLMGVPIPEGEHVVQLAYRDGAVAAGLVQGATAWVVLAAAAIVALAMERREPSAKRRRDAEAPPR
jgi:hypothetical protein